MGTVPVPQGATVDPDPTVQAMPSTGMGAGTVPVPQGATIDPVPQDVTIPAAQDIPGGGAAGGVLGGLLSGAPSGIGETIQRGVTGAGPGAKAAMKEYPGGGDPLEDLLKQAGDVTGIPFLHSADQVHQALQTLTSAAKLHEEWQKLKQSAIHPIGVEEALKPGSEAPTSPDSQVGKALVGKTPKPSAGKEPVLRDAPPEIATAIQQAAIKYGLDPKLIRAVVQSESNFNPKAKGTSGEIGLMQLMPETRTELGMSDEDASNIEKNIDAGARWLKQKIDAHGGDLRHGLTAYNGSGPKARQYAESVLALYGGQGSP